jgi:hypothetical protein
VLSAPASLHPAHVRIELPVCKPILPFLLFANAASSLCSQPWIVPFSQRDQPALVMSAGLSVDAPTARLSRGPFCVFSLPLCGPMHDRAYYRQEQQMQFPLVQALQTRRVSACAALGYPAAWRRSCSCPQSTARFRGSSTAASSARCSTATATGRPRSRSWTARACHGRR